MHEPGPPAAAPAPPPPASGALAGLLLGAASSGDGAALGLLGSSSSSGSLGLSDALQGASPDLMFLAPGAPGGLTAGLSLNLADQLAQLGAGGAGPRGAGLAGAAVRAAPPRRALAPLGAPGAPPGAAADLLAGPQLAGAQLTLPFAFAPPPPHRAPSWPDGPAARPAARHVPGSAAAAAAALTAASFPGAAQAQAHRLARGSSTGVASLDDSTGLPSLPGLADPSHVDFDHSLPGGAGLQLAGAYLATPLAHSSSELGFFFHKVLPESWGPLGLVGPPEGSELGPARPGAAAAAAAAAPCLPIAGGAAVTAGSIPMVAPRPPEAPLPAAAVADRAEAAPPPRAKPSARPAGRAAGRAGAGGAAPRGAGEAEPGHKCSLPVSCSSTELHPGSLAATCPPPLQRLGSPVLLEPSVAAPGSPFADFPSWALAPGGQLISPSMAAAAATVWDLALGGQAGLPGRRRPGPASDSGGGEAALQDGSTGTEEAGTEVQDTFAAAVLGHGQGLMAGRKRAAAREPGGSGGSGGGRASGGSAKKKGHAQAGLAARARGGSGGGSDGSDYESTSRAAQRAARAALANPAVSYNDPAGLPFAGAAPAGLARGTAVSHSSTSTFKGVTRHRWTGKWESHLWDAAAPRKNTAGSGRTRGRQVYLGGFATEVEAARAYDLAALAFWGTAAATNLPLSEYTRELGALAGMSRDAVVATLRRGDVESFTPRAAPDHPAAEALQQLAAAVAAAAATKVQPGGEEPAVKEEPGQLVAMQTD
ncbi:BBM2 [Scenedesmus sp. PABB004]|nr:BBM2 [Scenedesmus sp. PABB004]